MKVQSTCPICYGGGYLEVKKGEEKELNDYFEQKHRCHFCNGIGIVEKNYKAPKKWY